MQLIPLTRREASLPLCVVPGVPKPMASHEALEVAKERVGEMKLKHGDEAWRTAVNFVDPYSRLTQQRRVASRAYFKWAEMSSLLLHASPLQGRRVLHLCEAPGGFVQASCDLGFEEWRAHSLQGPDAIRFRALPPSGGRRLMCPANGDLLADDAFDFLCNLADRFDVVTADGSCEFESEHARAEECNFALCLREALVARRVLRPGGDFVLKLFDVALESTWGLVQLLTDWFTEVRLCKPSTSRASNGEVYLVCTRLRALDADRADADATTTLARVRDPVARLYPRLDPALCEQLARHDLREAQLHALTEVCDTCSGTRLRQPVDASAQWWATHGACLR